MEGPTVHRTELRMSREAVIVEEMKHFLLGHIFMGKQPRKIKTANSQAACFCPEEVQHWAPYPTEFCHASCGFPEKRRPSTPPAKNTRR